MTKPGEEQCEDVDRHARPIVKATVLPVRR